MYCHQSSPEAEVNKAIPIESNKNVELVPTQHEGVCRVKVLDPEGKNSLSWDRFVRLKAAADAIEELIGSERKRLGTISGGSGCDDTPETAHGGGGGYDVKPGTILDVGGYDGALALFLPDYEVDLIDPATTGACLFDNPLSSVKYGLTAAVDVLEHIEPGKREQALSNLSAVSSRYVVLNYPCRETRKAQELVFNLTRNKLIQEHVQWDLPDTKWVVDKMTALGFKVSFRPHSNVAVWLGQYILSNLAPDIAKEINAYLVEHHASGSFDTPLYHLVVCRRQ